MFIKKIKIKNIRSYESLELEIPKGSVLLCGDIGAGKTSILMAIEFALFGLQPSQKSSALMRNDAQDASVSLWFDLDGKIIEISRSLKKSKSITQDECNITIDGEKKEMSVTELKSLVLMPKLSKCLFAKFPAFLLSAPIYLTKVFMPLYKLGCTPLTGL